ncbi:MAG TPA: T3SS effector HopA1 family protein, partial [Urbifossiella sp.]|nr:T3SS effector HopA1 family protein [Urbifossiella sp.]
NGYGRADAGVLYLERRHTDRLGTALADVHRTVAADLRPEVPLFTRALAPGLGVAEDPGGALSFGQHRCRLAARAAWAAFSRGDADPAAVCAELLRAAGLDPDRPHLEPGSRDDYALEPRPRPTAKDRAAKRKSRAAKQKGRHS